MKRVRVPAAALVLLLAVALAPARAADPADLLPDLVADPPAGPVLQDYVSGGQRDLLLRFDGFIHNAGQGALDVRGSRAATTDPMVPLQRVYRSDGSFHDDAMPNASMIYSNADGHNHWHLQSIARYSLWNAAKTGEVAPAQKVGFCLDDSQHVNTDRGPGSPVYSDANGRHFCQQGNPGALSLFEGVSAGWRDLYDSSLALQWVVVSDVLPGSYWLREDVDPDGIVHEADEANPPAYSTSPVTIPGYTAKALSAPAGAFGAPQQVTLDAEESGSPGPRQFRIVTPPAHGTLDEAPGTAFTGPAVTYTPALGYSGPDSFTYSALDSTSPYPRNPATATVTLGVGQPGPAVAIEGAPASIVTGHGVQLHAVVTRDAPGVAWSASGGTISAGGFYRAPSSVPRGGSVTITARSAAGAQDQRTVRVVRPPTVAPAPTPPGSHAHVKGRLGPLSVGLAGRVLVASVTARRAGIVSLSARTPARRIGGCRTRVPAHRHVACRWRVPRHLSMRRLEVVARLTSRGKLLARRRRVGAPLGAHAGGKGLRGTLGLSRAAAAFLECRL